MFGWLKRRKAEVAPDEPIVVTISIEIERSARDLYALLDWADERHQLRARGHAVRQESTAPDVFRLWYAPVPDHNFLMTVINAEPGVAYSYRADIVPPIGLRLGSTESYTLEPLDQSRCRLGFVNTIHHVPGITRGQFEQEVALSSLAAARSLTKLKIQAEQGVAAVEEFERELENAGR